MNEDLLYIYRNVASNSVRELLQGKQIRGRTENDCREYHRLEDRGPSTTDEGISREILLLQPAARLVYNLDDQVGSKVIHGGGHGGRLSQGTKHALTLLIEVVGR